MTEASNDQAPTRGRPPLGRYLDLEELERLEVLVRNFLQTTDTKELVHRVGRDTSARRAAVVDLIELLTLAAAEEDAPGPIHLSQETYEFQKRGSLNRVFEALGEPVHLHLRRRRPGEDLRKFDLYWIRGFEPGVASPSSPERRPAPKRSSQGQWRFWKIAAVALALPVIGLLIKGDPFSGLLHARTADGRFVILEPGRVRRTIDQAEMVRVPAGEFGMGLTAEQFEAWYDQAVAEGISAEHATTYRFQKVTKGPFEGGAYPVYLDEYWIDRFEVTNHQYRRFVRATGHRIPEHSIDPARFTLWEGTDFPPELANHPVVNVSWLDADAYCKWADGDLPTEAQWEKAARGTDGRIYPWGDRWQRGLANTGKRVEESRVSDPDGPYVRTTPCGYFPTASPYGAKDMAGNVSEWVRERVEKLHLKARVNPVGGARKSQRQLRGGNWTYAPAMAWATVRLPADFEGGYRDTINGFRCVALIPELELSGAQARSIASPHTNSASPTP